jgi:hypothetical protein
VQVDLAGLRYSPHCLTRDFGSFHHEPVADLSQHVRPEAIDDLLREDDYYAFLVKFEDGPHIAIPKFIMGDFPLFTSPNGQCLVPLSRLVQQQLIVQQIPSSSFTMRRSTESGGGGSSTICHGDKTSIMASSSQSRNSEPASTT